MQELDDNALLHEYVKHDSEEAFATLVVRHINKVYSVAWRHTGNPHQAEEITQAVFVILSAKSRNLSERVILSGWLYETARLTAMTFVRSDARRRRREQEAHMQTVTDGGDSDGWRHIAPLLDAAMAGLSEAERHALVLRFFDGKSIREVGATLGATEDAAEKRISRAVEKLRRFFMKRGVSSTTAVIAGAISAHSVQAAPAALAKSVTIAAMTNGAAVSGSALVKGALKALAWAKAKTAILAGACALLAAGTVVVAVNKIENSVATNPARWRTANINLQTLEQLPPQVRILPSTFSGPGRRALRGPGNGSDRKIVGLGFQVQAMFAAAYGKSDARVMFNSREPTNRYDFICSLTDHQGAALQNELQKELGLAGKLELRETDVLLLTMKNPRAPGLKASTAPRTAAATLQARGRGHISGKNVALANLASDLEQRLNIPIVDQTGPENGRFDFELSWDQQDLMLNINGLKQALSNELGLELIPARKSTEMVVVDNAKP